MALGLLRRGGGQILHGDSTTGPRRGLAVCGDSPVRVRRNIHGVTDRSGGGQVPGRRRRAVRAARCGRWARRRCRHDSAGVRVDRIGGRGVDRRRCAVAGPGQRTRGVSRRPESECNCARERRYRQRPACGGSATSGSAGADPDTSANSDAVTNADPNPNTSTTADTLANTNAGTDTRANPDTSPNASTDTSAHPDTRAVADASPDTDANANANASASGDM